MADALEQDTAEIEKCPTVKETTSTNMQTKGSIEEETFSPEADEDLLQSLLQEDDLEDEDGLKNAEVVEQVMEECSEKNKNEEVDGGEQDDFSAFASFFKQFQRPPSKDSSSEPEIDWSQPLTPGSEENSRKRKLSIRTHLLYKHQALNFSPDDSRETRIMTFASQKSDGETAIPHKEMYAVLSQMFLQKLPEYINRCWMGRDYKAVSDLAFSLTQTHLTDTESQDGVVDRQVLQSLVEDHVDSLGRQLSALDITDSSVTNLAYAVGKMGCRPYMEDKFIMIDNLSEAQTPIPKRASSKRDLPPSPTSLSKRRRSKAHSRLVINLNQSPECEEQEMKTNFPPPLDLSTMPTNDDDADSAHSSSPPPPDSPTSPLPVNRSLYAVFDGHAGEQAAEYCRNHLHLNILRDPVYSTDLKTAVRNGILKTDRDFDQECIEKDMSSGSTAIIAILEGRELLVAAVGDSRAVLCRGGRPLVMNTLHTPVAEKERIEAAGGAVIYFGTWRVNGVLSVARAIGDRDLKPYGIIPDPDIREEALTEADEFLVLSSDGLYESMDVQGVVDFVKEKIHEGAHPSQICALLVNEAINKGSRDNVTAIIVFFS